MIMKRFLIITAISLLSSLSYAQIGFGTSAGLDIYQRYSNPVDDIAYPASGNLLLNFIFGPKIWIGGKKISLSVEAQANLGLTSLAIKDFKGLGAFSLPVIAKLNFNGLSGFYQGFAPGFAIGGGLQWSKTELYYLSDEYEDKGVVRNFNRTFIAELDVGVGSFGKILYGYIRYGMDFDNKASVLNIGFIADINYSFKKKDIPYEKPKDPLNE